jgi:hypothetical protein
LQHVVQRHDVLPQTLDVFFDESQSLGIDLRCPLSWQE